MSNFMGVGIFWIGLNRAGLGCWRLTLSQPDSKVKQEVLSSISSAGQWAYTEYSSFSGPPKGE